MNSFKLFRTICRSTCIFRNSYFNFMYCRLDDICKNRSGITYNRLIIIVIKNQCPFCGKSLRVVPINSEEYCPHCGCKIEQEHKKISVWRIEKIVKERIEGGANEKAVLRFFTNCPFVCINFDFFWLNKARQLYMDF